MLQYVEKVLQRGRAWIQRLREQPRGEDQTCAYGQKYQWLKDHDEGADELDDVRKLALQAADTAIRLDNSAKGWMRSLWDGSDRIDNDLTVFREDHEFKKLLGDT